MQGFLVVCPTHRDYRELARLGSHVDYCFLFHEYASIALEDLVTIEPPAQAVIGEPRLEIERILSRCQGRDIVGIVSTDDYPGSALAAVVAKHLGLTGPEPAINLICQHKYLSRLEQAKHVPEAVPPSVLVDVGEVDPPDDLFFPAFLKPVKSFFSIGAQRVNSHAEVSAAKIHWARCDAFFLPFEQLLQSYAGASIGTKRLIAEGLLSGMEVTVEGYVFRGNVNILGIVDSVKFPGTLAFSRFEYPSVLPEAVQERMSDIARRLVSGIGFDNGMFNIEMMYDADTEGIGIIEINPRMASQFADLYEKVDGLNSYRVLLQLASGKEPQRFLRQGQFGRAASCVLRRFDNRMVVRVPADEEIQRLQTAHPDVRVEVLAKPGRRLSQELQDGNSFRYGIMNLGGDNRRHILKRFDDLLKDLSFDFAPP